MTATTTTRFSLLATGALCAGCAAHDASTRATTEISRARTLIEQAERSGAPRYAAAELEQARSKLGLANEAQREGEEREAQARAAEAAADAELAAALAASEEAERAAEEVTAGVETLRRETNRPPLPNDSTRFR